MQKRIAICFLAFMLLLLCSCSVSEGDIYGTWYNDSLDERNVIQFSDEGSGKNAFVWVVYDLSAEAGESELTGLFSIDGDVLRLESADGKSLLSLEVELNGEELIISSDTAELKLTKYILQE